MAEEVEMTPVAAEPPKVNPLANAAAPKVPTLKLNPTVRKPMIGATPTATLKPGLKLPPKPGNPTASLKPGLKLPTQTALKPGLKLPPKPVIRKPGATMTAAPLPKPVAPAVAPAATGAAPAAPAAPAKPMPVDAQGVGKLPTVAAKAIERDAAVAPDVSVNPKPLEALKSVTQKLKGVTQEIPQQAILRKTGIIADGASDAQKEAAKHKTARISLSDAIGVAPVKSESAPMKTIRIKRPTGIPGATAPLAPQPKSDAPVSTGGAPVAAEAAKSDEPATPASASVTQRKTLKIARPGGTAVRPSGKFGIKHPSQATTVVKQPSASAAGEAASDSPVADIADIPDVPMAPVAAAIGTDDGPAWLWTLSTLVQVAACAAIGALAWFLYQNTQIAYF